MSENEAIISLMNDLILTCKDGEKGYREAAEGLQNAFYQMLLNDYSRQRSKFASQLLAQVVMMGGEPDRKGTVKGAIHRGWMNLKTAIAGKSDNAIISECKRGEEIAIKIYRDALKRDLPPQIKALLEQQLIEIIATEKRVSVMDSRKDVKHSS